MSNDLVEIDMYTGRVRKQRNASASVLPDPDLGSSVSQSGSGMVNPSQNGRRNSESSLNIPAFSPMGRKDHVRKIIRPNSQMNQKTK